MFFKCFKFILSIFTINRCLILYMVPVFLFQQEVISETSTLHQGSDRNASRNRLFTAQVLTQRPNRTLQSRVEQILSEGGGGAKTCPNIRGPWAEREHSTAGSNPDGIQCSWGWKLWLNLYRNVKKNNTVCFKELNCEGFTHALKAEIDQIKEE